ncbi:MAG: SDR family NAD(P)-dependent oxidoreductase [Massilia sp.]
MATHAAAKAFVLHFSVALQQEVAASGVRVMASCPGPTATGFFDGTPTTLSARDLDSSESVMRNCLAAFDAGKAAAEQTGIDRKCCHKTGLRFRSNTSSPIITS